jgi:hypothetical protein
LWQQVLQQDALAAAAATANDVHCVADLRQQQQQLSACVHFMLQPSNSECSFQCCCCCCRGLDELSSIFHIEMDTAREYDADYFGLANETQQHTDSSSSSSGSSRGSNSNDDAARPGLDSSSSSSSSSGEREGAKSNEGSFFVLRGFLRAHKVSWQANCTCTQHSEQLSGHNLLQLLI